MKKLYFAHPINTYGTPLERELLVHITDQFPDYEIVNPSDQIHKDEVARLKKDDPKANVMPYFIALVESCQVAVVLPFGDGMWGAGVWAEANQIYQQGGDVWVILDHRNYKMVNIPPQSQGSSFVPRARLTVEETRARIRNPDGTSKPYA